MRADLHRVRRRESEIRDADPGLVACRGSLELELLGDLGVLTRGVVGTLDPNNGKGLTRSVRHGIDHYD